MSENPTLGLRGRNSEQRSIRISKAFCISHEKRSIIKRERVRRSTKIYNTDSSKNIPARFREWLAEKLRHSAFLGWAAEHLKGDSPN